MADDMEAQLRQYYDAIESEFKLAQESEDQEAQVEVLRKRVGPKMTQVLDALCDIAINGESESAQIASAKFLIAFMYGKDPSKAAEKDGFTKVLEALQTD